MSDSGATPLTHENGEFPLDAETRKFMCYMSNGHLYVGKAHQWNPVVSSFRTRMERMKRDCQVIPADLAFIESLYAQNESQPQVAQHSDIQKDFIDLARAAVAMRASDIHIRVSDKHGTQIFFRIHNDLQLFKEFPRQIGEKLTTTIYQTMADIADATFETLSRQDARIADPKKLPEGIEGIRIATSPQVGGQLMVMRLLYDDAGDGKLESLGFSGQTLNGLGLMARRPTGINLIAGPTGSGKSTTLQRVLTNFIRETRGQRHVITVEDPPEYPIRGAVQTPVANCDTEEARSVAFQAAIKSAMRLDPDVIMIGEIRDGASARLAVQAAMTGHQVWSTVHANNALAILDRLIDLGVPKELAYDPTIITGLMCQRLLKELCPECKVPFADRINEMPPRAVQRVYKSVPDVQKVFLQGTGCEHCNHTGTIGRVAISEIVVTDEKLMQLLRSGLRVEALTYWHENQNATAMIGDAINKIMLGIVDPFMAEEVVGPLTIGAIEVDHTITAEEVGSAV